MFDKLIDDLLDTKSISKPTSSSSNPQRRRYYSSSDSEPEHDEEEVEGRAGGPPDLGTPGRLVGLKERKKQLFFKLGMTKPHKYQR